MQIASSVCNVCQQKIVLAIEGRFCPDCRIVAHRSCEPESNCSRCGQPYQEYERAQFDPAEDAIVPRALRESKSGAPAVAIGFSVIMALLLVLVLAMQ